MIPQHSGRASFVAATAIAAALAAGSFMIAASAQVPPPQGSGLLVHALEPGQGLAVRQTAPGSGYVTFATRRGLGLRVAAPASAPAAERALAFIDAFGAPFGVASRAGVAVAGTPTTDGLGIEHVTLRQVHQGVPVTGGELRVHLRGNRVVAANGEMVGQLPVSVVPGWGALAAEQTARLLIEKHRPLQAAGAAYSQPRLEIFNRGVFDDAAAGTPSRLAWFIEVTGPVLREYVWVDAGTGELLLNFSQLASALQREVFDAAGTGTLPGTLVRAEGGAATGDPDQDGAYDLSGVTYDYFFTKFGRDSFDDAGGKIVSTTDFCPTGQCPYTLAFWNGAQMLFGDGFATTDDIVAHEITHGVIEYSSDLFYYSQSGALNESYADIFGEAIDLTDGIGTDTAGVRWLVGEDQPGGAVRNMMVPTAFGDPGKMSDSEFVCSLQGWTDTTQDQGGVHSNSGVPNHAFALMVDGGTYNGHTVTGIGLDKAARIQYRALTTYLTSGSGFLDNYHAVNQACDDLALAGTAGITASDCTQVASALQAVEMADPQICQNATPMAPVCPTGAAPLTTVFLDDFEAGGANTSWNTKNEVVASTVEWGVSTQYASGSLWAAYGVDPNELSEHYLELATSVVVPAGGRLYFEHAFEFENDNLPGGQVFDGGVIEYSENDGISWIDIGSLIEDGQAYNSTISASFGNPLAGRAAFGRASHGFTTTRVDLSSLAGKSILIRFGVGSDTLFGSLGWSLDNVQIYSCLDPTPDMVNNGTFSGGLQGNGMPVSWLKWALPTINDIVVDTTGGRLSFYRPPGSTQAVVFQQTGVAVAEGAPLQAVFSLGNTDPIRKRISVLIHDQDFSDLSVCTFWLDPSQPLLPYTVRTHTTEDWTGATISFYAATMSSGGYYVLDNVQMTYEPTQSFERTDCIDPNHPGAGGAASGELLANGDFSGGMTSWSLVGGIVSQVTAGVFEFFRSPNPNAGVVLQATAATMANDDRMIASFELGNSSTLRQRVTVILHDLDFSDLHACTFWLPPGLPLSEYSMVTYATKAWANATLSVYPSTVGASPGHEWLELDDVSLARTNVAVLGTACVEPGG